MPHITPIAFIDTFDLVASLPAYMGAFRSAGDPGVRWMRLRDHKTVAEGEGENIFTWYQPYGRWIEMKNMLGQLKRIGDERLGEIEWGRVYLEMLDPVATLPWRAQTEPYYQRFMRAHLPLRTNPAARIMAETESANLLPGLLTIVNVAVVGSATNFAEWPRVHLVCDFRRKGAA
jgi:aspartyl/asparaginyl beta-hydroxylase